MTATWLDFCVRLDGPKEKQGYPGIPYGSLEDKEGEVDHSTEGPLTAALGELQKLERQASWPFTVPKSGPPLQHYPLEAITWHSGLPGDRRTDTSLVGNLTLIGIEHVDWPDNALNDNQLYWSVELTKAFRRLCPRIAARPPMLRVNLWEHNWLSATACPSGLIPWPKKLAALQSVAGQEEDMAFPPPHYHSDTEGAVMLIGLLKHPLDAAGHAAAHRLGSADIGPVDLSGLQWLAQAMQQGLVLSPAAGGLSEERLRDIVGQVIDARLTALRLGKV